MTENKTIGITGLIIGVVYGISAFTLENASHTFFSGPTVFPRIITIGTILLSLLILVQDFKKDAKKKVMKYDPKVLKAMGIYTAIFAIYIAIFEKLGFLLSTIYMLTSMLFVLNKGKSQYRINLILGIIFPTLCYLIFAKIFSISLPRGILPF